jgi:hypothetical protein
VVYENVRGYDKIDYLRSSDGGNTWSQHRVLSQNNEQTIYPHIIRWNQGLMSLWRAYRSNGPDHFNIAYSISNNDGLTWSTPQYALNNNWEWPFSLAVSGWDSLVNIMATWGYADSMHFNNIRSTNFGQSWSAPVEIFSSYNEGRPNQSSIINFVHFVWDGRFDLQHRMEIYYTQSSDGGIHWSPNIPLSDTDQFHSQLPAIACDSSGVVCSWMDYKYSTHISTGDIFIRISPDSGFSWNPEIQVTRNHYAVRSDIAEEGDTIYLAWEDYRPENGDYSIYSARSVDGGINWDEPYWVDGDTNASWNPAIAASSGKVYLVWYDGQLPDSSGLYFSRYMPENDAINEGSNDIPFKISLRAYPNPFNSSITINYSSGKGGETNSPGRINIYNTSGQLIRSFKAETEENGKVVWDATDKDGQKVSSGTYFVTFISEAHSKTLRLIYLK